MDEPHNYINLWGGGVGHEGFLVESDGNDNNVLRYKDRINFILYVLDKCYKFNQHSMLKNIF